MTTVCVCHVKAKVTENRPTFIMSMEELFQMKKLDSFDELVCSLSKMCQ